MLLTNKKQKTKEYKVVNFLKENKIKFIHDKSIGYAYGNYIPDILIDMKTHNVIVEIDENQHKQYDKSCEISRMLYIHTAQGVKCVFIRYNPDSCRIDGKSKRPKERLDILLKEVKKNMENIPKDEITVYLLFYDCEEDEYVVKYDIGNESMKMIENLKK